MPFTFTLMTFSKEKQNKIKSEYIFIWLTFFAFYFLQMMFAHGTLVVIQVSWFLHISHGLKGRICFNEYFHSPWFFWQSDGFPQVHNLLMQDFSFAPDFRLSEQLLHWHSETSARFKLINFLAVMSEAPAPVKLKYDHWYLSFFNSSDPFNKSL